MAKEPQPRAEPAGVTSDVLARLWDCSEVQVRKYAREGIAIKLRHGRYDLARSTTNLIVHLRKMAAAHRSADGAHDIVAEGAKLKATQRRFTEMRIEEKAGRLISIEDVEILWAGMVASVRQLFLAFPGRARFDLPHLTGHDQEKLQRLARDMLDEIAVAGRPKLPPRRDDAQAA